MKIRLKNTIPSRLLSVFLLAILAPGLASASKLELSAAMSDAPQQAIYAALPSTTEKQGAVQALPIQVNSSDSYGAWSQLLPPLEQYPDSPISIPATLQKFGLGLVACTLLWAAFAFYMSRRAVRTSESLVPALAVVVGSYFIMAWTLGAWMIDDAAISFAYTENLVRGYGLVLHPNLPPQEAYSNTSWVLILALPRLLGVELLVAAKVFGLLLGAGAICLSAWLAIKTAGPKLSVADLLLLTLIAGGAPFVIWSASGLETAIHAILFMGVVYGAHKGDKGIWIAALCLGGLILTRPETPLVVAFVVIFWALYVWLTGSFSAIWKLWPLGVVPVLVLASLTTFRYWYFSDLFPNPYYAKEPGVALANVLEGGYYGVRWMLASFAFMIVPMVLLCKPFRWSLVGWIAAALLAGQFTFLVYSGGDWMRGFRFMAPILPTLAFLLVYSNMRLESRKTQLRWLTIAAIPLLVIGLSRQMIAFEVNPSVPITRVASQGHTIADMASRLEIERPTVAHHDAGGISYSARLELVDLAGLADRYIAQNKSDPSVMQQYLLVEKQPDFVLGSSVNVDFAAGATRFFDTDVFRTDYVYMEFPGRPYMTAEQGPEPLSHMRREHVKKVAGIEPVYQDGKLVKVVVTAPVE
jgi:hypothetical protein